jgi:hypothetical protein
MATLSTPSRVVWEYFDSLRRLVKNTQEAESDAHRRQSAALAVVMAVNVVEVFVNLWFRVRVEETGSQSQKDQLVQDLSFPRPASLERKLKNWPKAFLGKELDFQTGLAADFLAIKKLRNSIVHFSSTHETLTIENISIHGLADTSEYDNLSHKNAVEALYAAEGMLVEFFRLANVAEENIPQLLHGWAGRIPLPVKNAV